MACSQDDQDKAVDSTGSWGRMRPALCMDSVLVPAGSCSLGTAGNPLAVQVPFAYVASVVCLIEIHALELDFEEAGEVIQVPSCDFENVVGKVGLGVADLAWDGTLDQGNMAFVGKGPRILYRDQTLTCSVHRQAPLTSQGLACRLVGTGKKRVGNAHFDWASCAVEVGLITAAVSSSVIVFLLRASGTYIAVSFIPTQTAKVQRICLAL